jgi:4'-phosphopantetheinyl transferase
VTTVSVRWAEARAPASSAELLGDEEIARWRGLPRDEDQRMFISAHALARWVVSERLGVPVADIDLAQRCERCGGAHGRPEVSVAGTPGPWVSLAHAGGWVVAATAEHPVGVDLEPLASPTQDIASVALCSDEQAELDAAPSAERPQNLVRWWVRKEAVLKARGMGLASDPRTIRVTPPWMAPAVLGASPTVILHDLEVHRELAATVAVLGDEPLDVDVSRWRW